MVVFMSFRPFGDVGVDSNSSHEYLDAVRESLRLCLSVCDAGLLLLKLIDNY